MCKFMGAVPLVLCYFYCSPYLIRLFCNEESFALTYNLSTDPKTRAIIFDLIQETKAIINHPFLADTTYES
jgi:hypothetical protein